MLSKWPVPEAEILRYYSNQDYFRYWRASQADSSNVLTTALTYTFVWIYIYCLVWLTAI
jgi:hypothetical protein